MSGSTEVPPAPAASIEAPAPGVLQGVVELYLELVPKTGDGVFVDVLPGGARSLQRALDAYEIRLRAKPAAAPALDRVEAPVNTEVQNPPRLITLPREQQAALRDEEILAQPTVLPTAPTANRRQQAAAILIAVIALLTSLVQLLR